MNNNYEEINIEKILARADIFIEKCKSKIIENHNKNLSEGNKQLVYN